ncbi:hypothetical protein E2C01_022482 [Portunus trituberculatus]|uniref:Uncharacterized protein n=1 Tax=Portunus trituberculatus TaxID=210409 RepID=A0A5B7E762_PORTR|nr:hypothetical protein [Portunus trituberculatus]
MPPTSLKSCGNGGFSDGSRKTQVSYKCHAKQSHITNFLRFATTLTRNNDNLLKKLPWLEMGQDMKAKENDL